MLLPNWREKEKGAQIQGQDQEVTHITLSHPTDQDLVMGCMYFQVRLDHVVVRQASVCSAKKSTTLRKGQIDMAGQLGTAIHTQV